MITPRFFTCPQSGHPVCCQPAIGHVRIAMSCAQGIQTLQSFRGSKHWSDAERADIDRLIEGNKDSIVAHANAIIAEAF